jgi:hypothetical protein
LFSYNTDLRHSFIKELQGIGALYKAATTDRWFRVTKDVPVLRVNHVTLERILPRVWEIVSRRRIMSTGISKSPDSRYWRQLYRAALSEIGKSKLPERIADAEKAVVLRARELFQAAGDNGEETEALDDVMYALHALRSNYQILGVS